MSYGYTTTSINEIRRLMRELKYSKDEPVHIPDVNNTLDVRLASLSELYAILDKLIAEKTYRRSDTKSPEIWYWTNRFGAKIELSDIDDTYLNNCIRFVQKHIKEKETIDVFIPKE